MGWKQPSYSGYFVSVILIERDPVMVQVLNRALVAPSYGLPRGRDDALHVRLRTVPLSLENHHGLCNSTIRDCCKWKITVISHSSLYGYC